MTKDAGAWEPKVGEKVWVRQGLTPHRCHEFATVLHLLDARVETYGYELEFSDGERLCFDRAEFLTERERALIRGSMQ
jgi:hypothetical protein